MRRRGEPRWLLIDAVVAIHKMLAAEFGGDVGLRDAGLLDSALSRPRNLLAYADTDPPPTIGRLAASYAFGLVRNHPFVDGNKRIGLAAAVVFLDINGYDFHAPEEEAASIFLGLAAKRFGERKLTAWFEANAKGRRGRWRYKP